MNCTNVHGPHCFPTATLSSETRYVAVAQPVFPARHSAGNCMCKYARLPGDTLIDPYSSGLRPSNSDVVGSHLWTGSSSAAKQNGAVTRDHMVSNPTAHSA